MTFLKLLLIAPVAAALLGFAFANREWITIGFDPTGGNWLSPVSAPLYAALFAAVAAGAFAGGIVTWLQQARHRRAARKAETEAARLRQELQNVRFASSALARSA